jgi:hypothetical protein
MNKSVTLILALSLILTLTLCTLLVRHPEIVYAQDRDVLPDQNDVEQVLITLTRMDVNDLILDVNDQPLDVNDQTLELRYKIMNNSQQDIWVCNGVGWVEADDASRLDYEAYLEENNTLVIRKRLDVPTFVTYYIWPEGRYVRLRAGQERSESLSLKLPVRHRRLFTPSPEKQGVTYAPRLVLELGYHTKDLAQIILDSKDSPEDTNVYTEAIIPSLSSLNEGESVLRITVDGVHIPYEEMWVGYSHTKSDE